MSGLLIAGQFLYRRQGPGGTIKGVSLGCRVPVEAFAIAGERDWRGKPSDIAGQFSRRIAEPRRLIAILPQVLCRITGKL